MTATAGYPILTYEREADPSGEWIPMAVRMNLDLAGLKIRLPAWQSLAPGDREALLAMDAEAEEDVERFAETLARADA